MSLQTDTYEFHGIAKGIAIALGIVGPLFVGGVGAYITTQYNHVQHDHELLSARVDQNFERFNGLVVTVAENAQHVKLHAEEKDYWISRIAENANSIAKLTNTIPSEVSVTIREMKLDIGKLNERMSGCESACAICREIANKRTR